ncbi:hypothetical protein [Thiohalorhabdus methylotrophus]|uniref:DUF2946 domain-containing protein n=1 Tax=Thiohalorhabdus methylotrophus TaxID=3242694 RepID=A0ABV4TUL8_9GAMM
MTRLLSGLLMLAVLFAQSAWAWEGSAGGFEGGGHVHADGPHTGQQVPDEADSGQGHHCMHSPVHFVAIPVDSFLPGPAAGAARILPAPPGHSRFSPAPPEQPPTA